MMTVLVVEDEPAIASVLRLVLEDEGYRVLVAPDGQEGLKCLAEEWPDLVLADVMMPQLDGVTMCRQMQENPRYRDIPLVLMSAAPRRAVLEHCQYAAFLAKPFSLDAVVDTVAQCLNRE